MSTISPTVSRTVAAQVAATEAYMLDAPVSVSVTAFVFEVLARMSGLTS